MSSLARKYPSDMRGSRKIFPEVEGVNRRPEWVPLTFGTESPNDTGEQKLLNGDVTDFKNIAVL